MKSQAEPRFSEIAKKDLENGMTGFNHRDYEKAVQYFKQALSLAPQDRPQRSVADQYARQSATRGQQQSHLRDANAFLAGKTMMLLETRPS